MLRVVGDLCVLGTSKHERRVVVGGRVFFAWGQVRITEQVVTLKTYIARDRAAGRGGVIFLLCSKKLHVCAYVYVTLSLRLLNTYVLMYY